MKHELEKATFERRDARGSLIEVRNRGPWETVITGSMKQGAVMGNHYHKKTTVFFFLVSGRARVDIVDVNTGERDQVDLSSGLGVALRVNQSHAIRFGEDSRYILLKDLRYDPKDPDTFEHAVPE
jgi:quercetin dioxygenase-like cupin family protein